MTPTSETSSSDAKATDSDRCTRNSMAETLYLGAMCFAINCLSSIALETGSRGSFHSASSTRSAIFNNLFRRNYSLRIEVTVARILAAFVSTAMLTIGNVHGIPYLYLPWLINTIEGMVFYEGPALFGLARAVLSNTCLPATLFVLVTLLLYVMKLCFWGDVLVNFKRCWGNYDENKRLGAKRSSTVISQEGSSKGYRDSAPKVLDIFSRKPTNWQVSSHECAKRGTSDSAVKFVKNDFTIKSRRDKSSFTKITG